MSGDVFEIRNKTTGQVYAGKSVNMRALKLKPTLMTDLRNEISLLLELDHPNIARLYEYYETPTEIWLVLELCSGGEFYDALINAIKYTEVEAAKIFREMVCSVAYLHKVGIAHRDLKLENFVLENKEPGAALKLIDFGLSRRVGDGIGGRAGTSYYMAPEVLTCRNGRTYRELCDVWSLGILLFMMLTGRPPFDGETDADIMRSILTGTYSP